MKEKTKIILVLLAVVFFVIYFSSTYKFQIASTAEYIKIPTNVCNTYDTCYNLLSTQYTDEQIKDGLKLKCENNVCWIMGYMEVGE